MIAITLLFPPGSNSLENVVREEYGNRVMDGRDETGVEVKGSTDGEELREVRSAFGKTSVG